MPQNMCSPCKSLFKLLKETCHSSGFVFRRLRLRRLRLGPFCEKFAPFSFALEHSHIENIGAVPSRLTCNFPLLDLCCHAARLKVPKVRAGALSVQVFSACRSETELFYQSPWTLAHQTTDWPWRCALSEPGEQYLMGAAFKTADNSTSDATSFSRARQTKL